MKMKLQISALSFLLIYSCSALSQEQPIDETTGNNDQKPAIADETVGDNPATDQEPQPESDFSGEGSLGWITNSGNTDSESLNADIKTVLKSNRWRHDFAITAKKVRNNNVVTAERYLYTEKSSLSISNRTYAFGSLRYDDDRFDGFDYQASITLGIGWHLVNREQQHFDLELGAGQRKTKLTETGERNDENISRLSQHYDVDLSESTALTEDLVIESGETNTASEFTTALKVAVNSNLALKISYNVKRNSDPAPDSVPTDRTTSVNLVFGF